MPLPVRFWRSEEPWTGGPCLKTHMGEGATTLSTVSNLVSNTCLHILCIYFLRIRPHTLVTEQTWKSKEILSEYPSAPPTTSLIKLVFLFVQAVNSQPSRENQTTKELLTATASQRACSTPLRAEHAPLKCRTLIIKYRITWEQSQTHHWECLQLPLEMNMLVQMLTTIPWVRKKK